MKAVGMIIGIITVVLVVLFVFFNKSPFPPNIAVSYRPSLVGAGMVLIMQNKSGDHYYKLRVRVKSAKHPRSTSLVIDDDFRPSEVTELGWLELGNRVLESGDTVYISTDSNPIPRISTVPR
jgi:hypothetical protein